jgi:hypothetical protein
MSTPLRYQPLKRDVLQSLQGRIINCGCCGDLAGQHKGDSRIRAETRSLHIAYPCVTVQQ